MTWPSEEILDADDTYYRVHQNIVPNGELRPAIFREQEGSMSVDWGKYSTPEETRARGRSEASAYGVVTLVAGEIRSIEGMEVDHSPTRENRAHSEVYGMGAQKPRKTEIRLRLYNQLNGWTIPVESPAA